MHLPRLLSIFLILFLSLPSWSEEIITSESFQLDMRDADIREFIDTVAKLTEKTIVVDSRVKGKVDIRSHRELSRNELFETFLVQLGVNGYALVDLGNGIMKVIPAQGAKLEGLDVDSKGSPQRSERIITRVVQVDNVDVTKLVPILNPLINKQTGVVAPYAESNILLITDKESNVRRLLEIISRVDQTDTQTLDVVKLENAAAAEMERILTRFISQMKQGKDSGISAPSVVADIRTNSLLLRGDANVRAYLRKVIKDLDQEVETSANTKVVYLKYAKASELVGILGTVRDSMVDSQSGGKESNLASNNQINIEAHDQTNSLILSGSPVMIQTLEGVIQKLDIRRAQVLVEAIIVEIAESKAKDLGVQWLFQGNDQNSSIPVGSVNFSNSNSGIVNVTNALLTGSDSDKADAFSGQGATLGIGYNSGGVSFGVLLNALAADSDSNVLSTPSLLTMDNQEAMIHVGQEVPIITGSTAGSNNDNPFQTITREDIGVQLKVTPQINDGDAVQLAIEQEVSSLSGLSASDIITNKRVIKTTVLVDDGQTIVLGGLIDDDVQESSSKVPVLGDIPGLGRAFKSDKTQHRKRNLMVFIRPTILRDSQLVETVTQDKYRYIKAEQLMMGAKGINLMSDRKAPVLPEWGAFGPTRSDVIGDM
ncbi:type II secretion system secretin GspD [Neptuniibacter sp. QD34_54]|uniref:type II secretion system secretin GspD n=1 Tax=Neptuniibacter sp. QD34_54 TaxID=3398208 RepID=UPI0039F53B9D